MVPRPPVVAVTAGDPCGVGPEVILKSLVRWRPASGVCLLVIGDHRVFPRPAPQLRLRLPPWRVWSPDDAPDGPARLSFLDCGSPGAFVPGRASASTGRASLDYLDRALELWREGRIQALVTAPVTKWAVARIHPGFTGHTEYLAGALGARDVAMMFVSDRLRVALVTRHIPLFAVPRSLTPGLLRTTIMLTADALTAWFGIHRPRLALCGLNPHAGEGAARSEEARVMRPVLLALRRGGLRCDGPVSADGLFAGELSRYDAIICAYHDQGLIPFKLAVRDRGCQLTVGLPFARTSPDHGSALDIARQGRAHPGSMRYALDLAAKLTLRGAHIQSDSHFPKRGK